MSLECRPNPSSVSLLICQYSGHLYSIWRMDSSAVPQEGHVSVSALLIRWRKTFVGRWPDLNLFRMVVEFLFKSLISFR